jgi:RND family efflux transporter MFP subunit
VSPKLDEGSSFNEGDILLRIDSRDYELDIKTAEASLDDAKTALSIAQAESNFEREQWELSNSGDASDLRLKIPQLKKAESTVEAAEANLEKLKRNLEKTTIKAPYDGLVRKKNVDRGTVIGPGYLIANIYAIDYVEVKLPIPDEDLSFLDIPLDGSQINKSNQPLVMLKGSLGGKNIKWEGRIVRMEAEFDPKSRMAILIARVSDPYKYKFPLRVGQFVEAEITGRNYNNLYIIDRELIKNKNQVVTINRADSTLKYEDINVLRYVDDTALINGGLPDEVSVCITNLDVMYNGMKIRINK